MSKELRKTQKPLKAGGIRRPDIIVNENVQKVIDLIIDDGVFHLRKVQKKLSDTPPNTVASWYYKAKKIIRDLTEEDRDSRIKDRMSELHFLWSKAVEMEDYKLALEVNKSMAFLCGDNGSMNINMKFQEHTPAELVLKVGGEVK